MQLGPAASVGSWSKDEVRWMDSQWRVIAVLGDRQRVEDGQADGSCGRERKRICRTRHNPNFCLAFILCSALCRYPLVLLSFCLHGSQWESVARKRG